MKKTIKFTPAKLASLKHPISKQPEKWYDLGCDGLAVFVMPQPSLTKVFYASWSVVTYGADGKQKRSGRYKKLGRVGGSKNLEAIKADVVNNLPIWKANNIDINKRIYGVFFFIIKLMVPPHGVEPRTY